MRLTALYFILSLLITPVFAQQSPQALEARDVIAKQIEAFLRDDSETAYGFAAPNIQSLFPNADVFISMVKRGYYPVYRPKTFSFGSVQETDSQIRQIIEIEMADGRRYDALYILDRQQNGDFKISGVFLRESPGAST